jgi:hypothetical protein
MQHTLRWKWILSIPLQELRGHLSTASSSQFIMQHTHTITSCAATTSMLLISYPEMRFFHLFSWCRPLSQRLTNSWQLCGIFSRRIPISLVIDRNGANK